MILNTIQIFIVAFFLSFELLCIKDSVFAQTNSHPGNSNFSYLQEEDVLSSSNPIINLDLNGIPLVTALVEIAKKARVGIYFDADLVPDKELNIHIEGRPLGEALDVILAGTNLEPYTSERNILLRKENVYENGNMNVRSENKDLQETVQGQVMDAETGEALPGVNILVKGTTTGTSTDSEGEFELMVTSLNDTLVVSFIGYQSQEVPIDNRTTLNVEMLSEALLGDDIVVIGYGALSTRELSSSVSNVSIDDLGNQPVPQLTQQLQGRVSGVQISQTTGTPGGGMDVRIRGAASLTAGKDPLVVIDGNPIVGNLSNINPNEIESISVLKDASATSLYGSRAANGVILIETKSAVAGETRLNYNVYTGFQQVPQRGRPQMMNAREFATFQKEISEFNGQSVDPIYQNPEQYGEGTDWYDAITQVAPIHDHSLTLSTGSERFSATATAGYFKQDGVIVGSGYERYSLRVNTNFQPHERLSIGFNVAPMRLVDTNSGQTDGLGSVINETLQTSPLAPLHDEDGNLTLTAYSPGMFPTPNYVRTQKDRVNDNKNTQILSNLFIEYELIDGMYLKTSGNIDYGDSRSFNFNGTTTGARGVGLYSTPFASLNQSNYLSWVNENTLNYQFDVDNHSFDLLAGFTAQNFSQDLSFINAGNYPDDKVQAIGAAGTVSASSNVQEWALLSYLARVNYNYEGRYLLSASIRRDGSSRFGVQNRWGNFPSISLGWVLSEESFMNEIDPISFVKLRTSYGITGNFNIGNYTHIPTISTSNYSFDNSVAAGRSVDNLADRTLGWETNKQFNLGIDLFLLSDRIEFTYDYYHRNTSDLLFNVSVPRASGFSNIQTNIGELKFWGHEFSVRTSNFEGPSFSWDTNLNISFDRNVVESLGSASSLITGPGSGLIGGSHITVEGQPIGMLYGMIHQGVYVDQEDFDNSPQHSTSQVGTVKFKDANNDGVITVDDATIIGNPHPDFIFGITNNFYYRNFDLSISVTGTYGNEILRGAEQTLTNLDGVFNVLANVEDRWRSPDDPGSGRYGSVAAGSTYLERDWWGTQFLYDASHLSINNITLGYELPVAGADFLNRLRIYGSIQQLHIFTGYPGANPQVSQSQASTGLGIDGGSYPVPRTYSIGINIDF